MKASERDTVRLGVHLLYISFDSFSFVLYNSDGREDRLKPYSQTGVTRHIDLPRLLVRRVLKLHPAVY